MPARSASGQEADLALGLTVIITTRRTIRRLATTGLVDPIRSSMNSAPVVEMLAVAMLSGPNAETQHPHPLNVVGKAVA
jgi:hypothetical protein